mmetsp:Transcript_83994/g.216216  ORF Transcript_83994/g.216216 Transcript_83994/m.216216 type:complete len:213 (+) Transcript_83994:375-1013(+)
MSPPKKLARASKTARFFFSTTRPVSGPMIGGDTHQSMSSPVVTLKEEPCSGHTITSPMTSAPSLMGVPMCGQRLPTQKSWPPSVLPISTSTPPRFFAMSCVGARSLAFTPDFSHCSEGRITCVEYLAAVFEERWAAPRRPAASATLPSATPATALMDSPAPASPAAVAAEPRSTGALCPGASGATKLRAPSISTAAAAASVHTTWERAISEE